MSLFMPIEPGIWPYVLLAVAYTVVDRAVFAASAAPTTRNRQEWTYWAVTIPYYACIVCPLLELATGLGIPTAAGMAGGAALVAAAAWLRWTGVKQLGRSFSAAVETHREHALVDTGLYRVIRHPLYLGLALLYAGLALFAGARLSWIVIVLGWAGIGVRIIAEERWLSAHLPGYQAYMQRTKRLIPGVW